MAMKQCWCWLMFLLIKMVVVMKVLSADGTKSLRFHKDPAAATERFLKDAFSGWRVDHSILHIQYLHLNKAHGEWFCQDEMHTVDFWKHCILQDYQILNPTLHDNKTLGDCICDWTHLKSMLCFATINGAVVNYGIFCFQGWFIHVDVVVLRVMSCSFMLHVGQNGHWKRLSTQFCYI